MIKDFFRSIFGSLENDVDEVLDLEKSIKESKDEAAQLSDSFHHIYDKLKSHAKTLTIANSIEKSKNGNTEVINSMLNRIHDKMNLAKTDYENEVKNIIKSTNKDKRRVAYLMNKEGVKDAVIKYKSKQSENSPSYEIADNDYSGELSKSELNVLKAFNLGKINEDVLIKAVDTSKLQKKEIWVTRGGKTFKQTVYVKSGDDPKKEKTPVGEEISPDVKGMNITKYSEKAMLITGDTYANIDTLRDIKKETKVGSWNNKLKGWVFPISFKETVLGHIWSNLKDKGEEEKAQAVQNQKNAGFNVGDEIEFNGNKAEISDNVSDAEGIKYNVKTEDGSEFIGVDERVLSKDPQTDDRKIAETINNTNESNRVKTEKELFGIKPIEDIHNYSLQEYMKMHGLSDEDIERVVNSFKSPKTKKEASKRASQGGAKKEYTKKEQTENLTKRQLIGKLVYSHYNAVKDAIEKGEKIKTEALDLYEELKKQYNQKRKAMSEETKRKISEALKKNKPDDNIDELSPKETEQVDNSFKKVDNEKVKKEQEKLAELISDREKAEKQQYEYYDKARGESRFGLADDYRNKAMDLSGKVEELDIKIRNQKNTVNALSNGGNLSNVEDKVGVEHKDIPDFSNVDSTNISYDVDNILNTERPAYIPDINEDSFRRGGYIFDVVRVDRDKYLVATNRYEEFSKERNGIQIKRGEYNPESGGYVLMTLDQLVLTQDYYTTKKKAENIKKADERNKRGLEHWEGLSDSKKERYLTQRNMYKGLPAKVKKKVNEEDWNNMGWRERESYYKPIKRYGVERLKTKWNDNTMATSFHSMYERFVNPEAQKRSNRGEKLKRGERGGGTPLAHPEVWDSWTDFREKLKWKINDINIQREELSNIRKKALETSYGNTGINNSLLNEYGVSIKRQNGEDIKPKEIEQLKNAWSSVQKTFGKLKDNALNDGLKLSHAGETYMYASKAIGVYVPSYSAIGVTAKLGESQLGFTMGHEVAHWIDNSIGKTKGKRFASDDFESTAGVIASELRKNMNEKTDSKYLNNTAECFARAMEMHHAIETEGLDAIRGGKNRYTATGEYVSEEVYNNTLKPLIKKFLDENKSVLKSLGADEYFGIDGDISKASIDELEDMIKEHKRLIDVIKPHAPMDERVAKELVTQEKELEDYKKELAVKKKKENSEPTEAQKKAGNYKKEKRNIRNIIVTIENKKGSKRSGIDEDGKEWSVVMNNDYGYFNKTKGKDGDHIDVFLSSNPEEGNIYVIDQLNGKGEFDEHKVMMGFKDEQEALREYQANYESGFSPKYQAIIEVNEDKLKKWLGVNGSGLNKGKKQKPFSELRKSIEADYFFISSTDIIKSDPCWDGYEQYGTKKKDGKEVPNCVKKSGSNDDFNEDIVPDDIFDEYETDEIEKAKYQGKDIELNKPFRDSGTKKKFGVYVKNDKGNVVKVSFGDPNLSIKRDDKERRDSFRARHKCSEKKDKTSAGYWSCKMWSKTPVSKITKGLYDLLEEGKINKVQFTDLIKARTGVYADNAQNRNLKRVGQKYGSSKQDDQPSGSNKKEGEDQKGGKSQNNDEGSKGSIEEQAKNASGSALEQAAKEANDPEVRSAAHKELDRREKEEKVQEGEGKENPTKEGDGKDNDGKNQEELSQKDEKNATDNPFLEKFKDLSEEQLKFYLQAPNKEVKDAAKQVLEGKNNESFQPIDFNNEKDISSYFDKYNDQIKNYSKDEVDALKAYRDLKYSNINKGLREDNIKEGSENSEYIDKIDSAFNSSYLQDDLTLTRLVDVKDEAGDFFKGLEQGDVYEDAGYVSSSLDKNLWGSFMDKGAEEFKINIMAKEGQKAIPMQNIGDEEMSGYKDEYEMLLPRNSRFKVVKKDDNGITVEML